MKNVVINAIGDACPLPVVKTIKALKEVEKGSVIEVHVDNETAVQNVMKSLSSKNIKPVSEKIKEKEFIIRGEVLNSEKVALEPKDKVCIPDALGDTVVAIESETMGNGDNTLGEVLMKSFIYTLTQLEELPKAIIFYNAGAKLTLNNSAVLQDIKNLEAQGVEVITCGTCLDYFEVKEELGVGSVSNMYTIVEKLNSAAKVIKP
ncbi:MAG: sulfurtransferase-like selenium metabolism protein YedF [Eubacteriales bacterium]